MDALEGLRILDLTQGIAGPLGVLALAEHGADVIKIEPPGDRPRTAHPVHDRSRRSMTLDLSRPEGAGILRELCASADVLVESFAAGTMAGFGLDYESLAGDFPRLVYCSIPAWPSGTRFEQLPGYEALVHARTGQQWEVTGFRSGPVFLHSPVASHAAMHLAAIGVMAALVSRHRTGRGQRVEVSLLQGAMALTTQGWNWTDRGQFMLAKTQPPGIHQSSIYECADGEWVHAATMAGVPQERSEMAILGLEEVGFAEMVAMGPEERRDLEERKRAAYRRRQRAELIEEFHANGLGCEAIVAPHEKFAHPQLQATGSVVEVDDPELGRTTQLGPTVFMQATPGRVCGPRPGRGADTADILRQLGRADADIEQLRSEGVV